MNEWVGKDRKLHIGFIDKEDPYMQLREDDYPGNSEKLKMFNFKRDKVQAYERAQNAINQGLVIFPASLNARNEIEFEETDVEGNVRIRYEKADKDELNALVQLDLLKEELIAMQKIKKPNGTIQFDLSPDAKSKNFHDWGNPAVHHSSDIMCEFSLSAGKLLEPYKLQHKYEI